MKNVTFRYNTFDTPCIDKMYNTCVVSVPYFKCLPLGIGTSKLWSC